MGEVNGAAYAITDDHAQYFAEKWRPRGEGSAGGDMDNAVAELLDDEKFWGTNLSLLGGFSQAVKENVYQLSQQGVRPPFAI